MKAQFLPLLCDIQKIDEKIFVRYRLRLNGKPFEGTQGVPQKNLSSIACLGAKLQPKNETNFWAIPQKSAKFFFEVSTPFKRQTLRGYPGGTQKKFQVDSLSGGQDTAKKRADFTRIENRPKIEIDPDTFRNFCPFRVPMGIPYPTIQINYHGSKVYIFRPFVPVCHAKR